MPYITKVNRTELNECINTYYPFFKPDGRLNYFLAKLFLKYMSTGMSYKKAKEFIGELEMAKMEIYRRWIIPYENDKKYENGDVEWWVLKVEQKRI